MFVTIDTDLKSPVGLHSRHHLIDSHTIGLTTILGRHTLHWASWAEPNVKGFEPLAAAPLLGSRHLLQK
jgi:hypothetical protein